MLPIGVGGYAAWVAGLVENIRHLEEDLDIVVRLLGAFAVRFRAVLGPDALGPELGKLLVALDVSRQEELAARLNELTKRGAEPAAVREVRDVAGCTWDEAFALIRAWDTYTTDQKARWARLVLVRCALNQSVGNR
jgi:hypothetical protein